MKSEAVQMIVFDLDDTLHPEIQFVKSGFRAVSYFLKNTGITSSDLFQQMWSKFCGGARRTVFNEVLADEGIACDGEFIRKIVDFLLKDQISNIETALSPHNCIF